MNSAATATTAAAAAASNQYYNLSTSANDNATTDRGPAENNVLSHSENVDSGILYLCGFVPFAVILWACLGSAMYFVRYPEKHKRLHIILCFVVLFALFLTSLIFMAYGGVALNLDETDYYGPMRIENMSVYQKRGCNRGGTCRSFAYVEFQLDWGYQWACGDPERACRSEYYDCHADICHSYECSPEEVADAIQKATECAKRTFDVSAAYAAYNPLDRPSDDENWPSVVAYGDCQTCESLFDVPSLHTMEALRVAGFCMLGFSATLVFGVLYYCWTIAGTKVDANASETTRTDENSSIIHTNAEHGANNSQAKLFRERFPQLSKVMHRK